MYWLKKIFLGLVFIFALLHFIGGIVAIPLMALWNWKYFLNNLLSIDTIVYLGFLLLSGSTSYFIWDNLKKIKKNTSR